MLRTLFVAVCAAGAVFAAPALTAPALAQGTIRISPASGGGLAGGAEPGINRDHLRRYAEVLNLTDDQRAAMDDMLQTYLNEHATAAALMTQKIDDARAESEESGQFENFIKTMNESRAVYRAAMDQASARFFDDLRLLLTAEQDVRWADLERTRRRVETISRGSLSGESVDLVQLVDDMGYDAGVRSTLEPILASYETSMDAALAARNELQAALAEKMNPTGGRPPGFFENDGDVDKIREASIKVREVNQTFARQISDSLPTDLKPGFDEQYRHRSFPQAYSDTYTERVVDTALTFEDLSPEQQKQIDELRARFLREMDAANNRLAEAIRADEESPDVQTLIAEQFGVPMQIRIGEELEQLKKARDERSEVARQYLDQVRSLLSPEQQARLPRREPAQRSVGAGGGMRMMVFETTTTTDSGGDAPPPPPPPAPR